MAYKLSGGAGGDINTERKERGGRRKVRPRPAPRPRTASGVGRAVTRGAVKASPQPARTRAVVRARAQARTRVNRAPTRAVAAKVTSGAVKQGARRPSTGQMRKRASFSGKRTTVGAKKVASGRAGRSQRAKALLELRRQLPRYDKTYEDGSGLGSKHFPFSSPSTVADARYKAYAKRLWPKVRRHYGLPKGTPMPKLTIDKEGGKPSAYVPWDDSGVHVSSDVPLASSSKGKRTRKGRDYARGVLIHEWAHTRQRKDDPKDYSTKRGRADIEGSAEAFERIIRRKLGLRQSTNAEYRPFAKSARKKGRRYVLDRQFKGDK